MSDKPTVYVTREIPKTGIKQLEEEYEVHVWREKLPPSREELISKLDELDPDGLLCLLTETVDEELMDVPSNLKAISTFSVGYDHIDLPAATEREIAVGHTPGVLTDTTADFAWALLMTCARRTVEGHEYVDAGQWETWGPTLLTGPDIHGATLGIVGFGDIGQTVAKRAAGFDMKVLYSDLDRNEAAEQRLEESGVEIEYAEQDEVLRRSDFVSLHTPLFESTRHLIDKNELQMMKEEAILINTSRGPIVNTDALDTALEKGWISRAGLDVTDPEPLPTDHSLLEHAPERLVVTPHIASASIQTRDKMAEMAAANLLAGLNNEELPHSALSDANIK